MTFAALLLGALLLAPDSSEDDAAGAPNPALIPRRGREAAPLDEDPDHTPAPGRESPRRGLRLNGADEKTTDAPEDDHFSSQRRRADERDPERGSERGLETVDRAPQKVRPPELLAEALGALEEGAVTGQAVSLETTLKRAGDRAKQLEAVKAYWNLAYARGAYHFAREERRMLEDATRDSKPSNPAVRSALAEARARVLDSQSAVLKAQRKLAQAIQLGAGKALPLTSDRPHVGGYETQFEEIFSGQSAPERLVVINRDVPLRREVIDVHAEAVVASHDMTLATIDDYQANRGELAHVTAAIERLGRERRAFLIAVRDYNNDIGEYALAVLGADLGATELAEKLIKKRTAKADTTETDRDWPTRGSRREPAGDEPARPDTRENEALLPANRRGRRDASESRREAQYRPSAESADAGDGVYQGLADLEPEPRAKELAGLLYWNPHPSPEFGRPTSLADCLKKTPINHRKQVILAYWKARERIARHQTLAEASAQLASLRESAIESSRSPAGARAVLVWRAEKLSMQARLIDEQIALVKAEFALSTALGGSAAKTWILPSTTPLASAYNTAESAGPKEQAISEQAALLKIAHEEVMDQAERVVFADAFRAGITGERAAAEGAVPQLERAVYAIDGSTDASLAFLSVITDYNELIANYAIDALAADASNEALGAALGVTREDG